MEIVLFLVVIAIFLATAIVTLLGVAGRIRIEGKYLWPLVSGLLLENAAAVIFLFTATDFFNPSGMEFIKTLPAQVRGSTLDESRSKIANLLKAAARVPDLNSKMGDLVQQNGKLRSRIEKLERYEQHFLIRLVKLYRDAGEFGNSVNLVYPPSPQKRQICRRLQELLAELGYYDGSLDGDPETTREALIRYQTDKGFTVVGYFAKPTVDAMIADHLKLAI